jgi:hypothetical protein
MLYDRLGKHAKTSRKQHRSFCSKFVPKEQSYGPYRIRIVRTVLSEFENPYSTVFFAGLYFASISVPALLAVQLAFDAILAASICMLVCCLGMRALALRNGCSLAARKCCLSCSLKNDSTSQEWVCPLALIDLMREGEGFSNLTVEIRLDEWLRFGVSSLTLTLVIKSHFNLHLTN